MAGNPKVVAKYSDQFTAIMAKQALDDAGIPAFVLGANIAELYPETPFAKIEVQVPDECFDEAKAIIADFEATLEDKSQGEFDEDDDDTEDTDEPIDE